MKLTCTIYLWWISSIKTIIILSFIHFYLYRLKFFNYTITITKLKQFQSLIHFHNFVINKANANNNVVVGRSLVLDNSLVRRFFGIPSNAEFSCSVQKVLTMVIEGASQWRWWKKCSNEAMINIFIQIIKVHKMIECYFDSILFMFHFILL